MPDEVTKSLEEELDDLDAAGDVYEDADEREGDPDDKFESSDKTESETETTEEKSDDEEEDGKEETIGEETSEETDTSGEAKSEETKEGETESETSKDLDGQQRIAGLIAEIDRLSGLLVTQTPGLVTSGSEDTPKTTETVKVEETLEDFVGDLDMDDVASHSQILNEVLNKVFRKGIETSKQLSIKQADTSATSVSKTVANQVENALAIKNTIDKFYDANPELSNVKQVVQACASQIVQDSPDKSFKDVLNLAAEAARKTLGIPRQKTKTKIAKADEAAFAEQKGGQRKKVRKVSKLQQELDEL